jgi:hypothetical protein
MRGGPEPALAPVRDSRIAEATRTANNPRGPVKRQGLTLATLQALLTGDDYRIYRDRHHGDV